MRDGNDTLAAREVISSFLAVGLADLLARLDSPNHFGSFRIQRPFAGLTSTQVSKNTLYGAGDRTSSLVTNAWRNKELKRINPTKKQR